MLGKRLGAASELKNSGCLAWGCFAADALTVCTQLHWLWLPQSPLWWLLLFCVRLSCCTTNLREEMDEKLDCHSVCPDLVYNIQFGKPLAIGEFCEEKAF